MAVSVRIPTTLRPITGGNSEVKTQPGTVRDVLAGIEQNHPGFASNILDDSGELRRFVNVFVDDEDVRYLQGIDTEAPAGVTVAVVPAVAGG